MVLFLWNKIKLLKNRRNWSIRQGHKRKTMRGTLNGRANIVKRIEILLTVKQQGEMLLMYE